MPHVPKALEYGMIAFSVVMFVASIVAIPIVVRRLSPDHFVRPPPKHSLRTKVMLNASGALLIALGIAMLVLPGQGIIAILFGMSMMDVRIKHRVLRRLLTQSKIQEAVQQLRSKAGKPPLVIPEEPVTA
jgi:hypothetical protein